MGMSNYKYVERMAVVITSQNQDWLIKEGIHYPTNDFEVLAFKRIAKNSRRKNYVKNVIYTMECDVRHFKKKKGK